MYLVPGYRFNSKKYAWSIVCFLTPHQAYVSDRSMSIDIFMDGKLLQSAGLVVSHACQVYFVCLVQRVVYNQAASQLPFSVQNFACVSYQFVCAVSCSRVRASGCDIDS